MTFSFHSALEEISELVGLALALCEYSLEVCCTHCEYLFGTSKALITEPEKTSLLVQITFIEQKRKRRHAFFNPTPYRVHIFQFLGVSPVLTKRLEIQHGFILEEAQLGG